MAVTALEISLNGKVLYSVGMEGWHSLGASIHGHRMSEQVLEKESAKWQEHAPGESPRTKELLQLECHVGLPDPDNPNHSKGQAYGSKELAVGDEITIRVIKTDNPDAPPEPPPSKGKPTLLFANQDGVIEP